MVAGFGNLDTLNDGLSSSSGVNLSSSLNSSTDTSLNNSLFININTDRNLQKEGNVDLDVVNSDLDLLLNGSAQISGNLGELYLKGSLDLGFNVDKNIQKLLLGECTGNGFFEVGFDVLVDLGLNLSLDFGINVNLQVFDCSFSDSLDLGITNRNNTFEDIDLDINTGFNISSNL